MDTSLSIAEEPPCPDLKPVGYMLERLSGTPTEHALPMPLFCLSSDTLILVAQRMAIDVSSGKEALMYLQKHSNIFRL